MAYTKVTVFATLFVAYNLVFSTFVASHETKSVIFLTKYLDISRSRVEKAMVMMSGNLKQNGLQVCVKFLNRSLDRIDGSIAALMKYDIHSYPDAHTWLSSVLSHHLTCLDNLKGSARISLMERHVHGLIRRAKIALEMFVALDKPVTPEQEDLPLWVTREDRKLLLHSSENTFIPNVVVAKDGSGNYTTVSEAVMAAPDYHSSRYIIYVKPGTYEENVVVGKEKTNLMIMGDDRDTTVITGSLNAAQGYDIEHSATLGVDADGFIAVGICIQNTAGPKMMQAVALRIAGDKTIVSRCTLDGYQDTLYSSSNRQLYFQSKIMGTIDFIFGNSQAVIQNCTILSRKPLDGQSNMITAQGRYNPNQNTAFSIQFCKIMADETLAPVQSVTKTYLGRPWQIYSRTMVMESFIGNHVDPAGWSAWDDQCDVTHLYFAEFKNYGEGADTRNRVNWPSYHKVTNDDEAIPFTVSRLIDQNQWLEAVKDVKMSYELGLYG